MHHHLLSADLTVLQLLQAHPDGISLSELFGETQKCHPEITYSALTSSLDSLVGKELAELIVGDGDGSYRLREGASGMVGAKVSQEPNPSSPERVADLGLEQANASM